jgi:hypothetical protein
VNVRYSAFAAIVLSAHGQNASTTTNENSLDAARRDLRALPATERSHEFLGKSSGLGSAGLPSLALPGESSKPQAQPEPNAPPSATWLQDAMKQTEVERSQRRSLPDSEGTREQNNGYKPAAAPDPFGKYLEQWLSPRDLEMLRPESRKTADQKQNSASLEQTQKRSGVFGAPASQTTLDAVPIMPTTQNPYLVEPSSLSPTPLPNPFAPSTPSALPQSDRNRVPTALPTSTSTVSPRSTAPVKPAFTPPEAMPKAPTAPIVDDRKYFPQLRRF